MHCLCCYNFIGLQSESLNADYTFVHFGKFVGLRLFLISLATSSFGMKSDLFLPACSTCMTVLLVYWLNKNVYVIIISINRSNRYFNLVVVLTFNLGRELPRFWQSARGKKYLVNMAVRAGINWLLLFYCQEGPSCSVLPSKYNRGSRYWELSRCVIYGCFTVLIA